MSYKSAFKHADCGIGVVVDKTGSYARAQFGMMMWWIREIYTTYILVIYVYMIGGYTYYKVWIALNRIVVPLATTLLTDGWTWYSLYWAMPG